MKKANGRAAASNDYMKYKKLAISIRGHCMKMTNRGKSGHLGSMLSMADILAVLYETILKVDQRIRNGRNGTGFY